MNDKERKKKDLQKLKDATPIFDEEIFPEVRKDIDVLLDKLSKELAENKKIIEENDREILKTISYEEFLRICRLV